MEGDNFKPKAAPCRAGWCEIRKHFSSLIHTIDLTSQCPTSLHTQKSPLCQHHILMEKNSTSAARSHPVQYCRRIRKVHCARHSSYVGCKAICDSESLESNPSRAEQQELHCVKFKLKGVRNRHFASIVFTN